MGWRSAPGLISSYLQGQTMLSPEEEAVYRYWWRQNAPVYRQGMDPWTPGHGYDYRKAYAEGEAPAGVAVQRYLGALMERQGDGGRPHWTSAGKVPGLSPERYLIGESGRIYDSTVEDPQEPYRYLLDED